MVSTSASGREEWTECIWTEPVTRRSRYWRSLAQCIQAFNCFTLFTCYIASWKGCPERQDMYGFAFVTDQPVMMHFVSAAVAQFFLSPVLLWRSFLSSILSSLLYAGAFSYYHYLSFLGYSALPFLERTEVSSASLNPLPLRQVYMYDFVCFHGITSCLGDCKCEYPNSAVVSI